MGTVYAKDVPRQEKQQGPKDDYSSHSSSGSDNDPDLVAIKARVDKINVDGLKKTKEEFLAPLLKEIFKANNFQDVIVKTYEARSRLEEIGCFKNIGVLIDTNNGPNASEDGLEVTFQVNEMKKIVGAISTSVGQNEGSLVVNLKTPNIAGRGERFSSEYSFGSKRSSHFNLALTKPFSSKYHSEISASLFQQGQIWPWSGYKFLERGTLLDFAFMSSAHVKHNIQWENSWRDVSCYSRDTAFEIRERAGPDLKSSLKFLLTLDKRDLASFPTNGPIIQLTSELAGLGGDVGFLKNELRLELNKTLIEDYVLQGTFSFGHLKEQQEKHISLCDQFYLGGPLTLRGFDTRGIGPRQDNNTLGSNVYWSSGLHLFAPLPFRPGRGGLGELFRTHTFINAGNIGNFDFSDDYAENLKLLTSGIRLSCGLGIALRLGQNARLEFNYCLPIWFQQTDKLVRGIQFGVGIYFT